MHIAQNYLIKNIKIWFVWFFFFFVSNNFYWKETRPIQGK